jgi:hypothetical protein
MVRRERWLLTRDGRHITIHRMLLLPIVLTQIQFAYLAVGLGRLRSSLMGCAQVSVASDQHHPANWRATATLATTWGFLRSLNRHHC